MVPSWADQLLPQPAFDGAILQGFCISIDGAFMGLSTPTTAFDGAI